MYITNETGDVQPCSRPSAVSDGELVASAQAGSHAAFVELFIRHQKMLGRTVHRITGNRHDTEDALQECSIRAFIHIKTFKGRSAVSTWLVRIALNTTLMMIRKRKRATVASLDDRYSSDWQRPWQFAEPSNNPEQELLEREMQFQIHQAVTCLPASLRVVTEACRIQDGPLNELAAVTGLSIAATKARLYRARRAVRDTMQQMRKESFESLH